jgi:hypothetical protein
VAAGMWSSLHPQQRACSTAPAQCTTLSVPAAACLCCLFALIIPPCTSSTGTSAARSDSVVYTPAGVQAGVAGCTPAANACHSDSLATSPPPLPTCSMASTVRSSSAQLTWLMQVNSASAGPPTLSLNQAEGDDLPVGCTGAFNACSCFPFYTHRYTTAHTHHPYLLLLHAPPLPPRWTCMTTAPLPLWRLCPRSWATACSACACSCPAPPPSC